jgi:hypothetical protein
LAEYLEQEPARKKATQEAQRAKLETLERKLGINQDGEESGQAAGKKHRLEDTEYVEQSREIVDNVKNAVKAGTSSSCRRLRRCLLYFRPAKEESKGEQWAVATLGCCKRCTGTSIDAFCSCLNGRPGEIRGRTSGGNLVRHSSSWRLNSFPGSPAVLSAAPVQRPFFRPCLPTASGSIL